MLTVTNSELKPTCGGPWTAPSLVFLLRQDNSVPDWAPNESLSRSLTPLSLSVCLSVCLSPPHPSHTCEKHYIKVKRFLS